MLLSFIIISAIYWCFCVVWFQLVQKAVFGLYNLGESTRTLTPEDVMNAYRHGFRSDAIIASYLTAVPLIVAAVATIFPSINVALIIGIYSAVVGLALGLLATADTLLYRFWKYKIDSSVFMYMRSAKGATASVSTLYLIGAVAAVLLMSATFVVGAVIVMKFALLIAPLAHAGVTDWWGYLAVPALTVICLAALFLVIRGLGIRPNTPSIAYFSSNAFLNHWALNPAYNIIYTLSRSDKFGGQFVSMDADECERQIRKMFPTGGVPQRQLLRTTRPDILLVVWESFGAEFSAAFGGREGICTNVDRLAAESVIFSRCTAGSFRTDRGLVNIISGYPAQPTTSIINHSRILPALPALARCLRSEGYTTEAIHGGDLTIMHKNDYYLASGHDTLLDQSAFPASAPKGKWGVHDGPAMFLAADEAIRLNAGGRPYFITLQTLSSHEPFDVPDRIIDDAALNAFAYTDRSLGAMVDRLKASPAWDNLLLIVVADHGFNASMLPDCRPQYAHIPLLMTGGAIAAPAVVDTIMGQTDIAATLLGQMGLPHTDFPYSRDVLSDTYTDHFALHIFNNGIMISDADGYTVLDTLLDRIIEGDEDATRIARAKTILQSIYQDLDKR